MTGSAVKLSAEDIAELVAVASQPAYWRWREMVRSTGGCADPIHLSGRSGLVHTASGEILHTYDTVDEPNRQLLVACRNRRASRCPSCAETYRADTYHLIRAGLAGGKTVPDTVVEHPRVFATFTAPSFGPVHHRVIGPDGKVRRCHPQAGCTQRHGADDPMLGQAIHPAGYDYAGAVMWNALAGKLWHRTATLIVRQLAQQLGLSEGEFRRECRVSYGKVAEFQTRGVVHFHVIIRLDGPEGPATLPPEALTVEVLTDAIRQAGARAFVTSPDSAATSGMREIRWGDQLDVQPITAARAGEGELTDQKVAGYVAKYATKAAESTGTLDRPIVCWPCKGTGRDPDTHWPCQSCHGRGTGHDNVHQLGVSAHAQAMISACWTLGSRPELEELRLRSWAHMLGFRGHFSTKSRRYSTTLRCLRKARQDWRNHRLIAGLGYPEGTRVQRQNDATENGSISEDTILVIGQWQYRGRGHSPGEAIYARTIAEDLAESRRIARRLVTSDIDWAA
jgi:hypothetical protein